MKLLAGLAALAGTSMAFSDTSPFFCSRKLGDLHYITEASNISTQMANFSKRICPDGPQIVIYRVRNLANKAASSEGTYVKHVHYRSPSELDFSLDPSCDIKYLSTMPQDEGENVLIVDVDDEHVHYIDEFLDSSRVVIVQGKPAFQKAGSRMDSLKNYVDDKLNVDLDDYLKRDDESDLADVVAQDVEDDFRAAESMIAQEENESFVTALAEDADAISGSRETLSKTKNDNLFSKYQFFTPGIWLALIVTFFLVFVIYTAVGWVTSIQTSYNAFEKQIDYEKKTE